MDLQVQFPASSNGPCICRQREAYLIMHLTSTVTFLVMFSTSPFLLSFSSTLVCIVSYSEICEKLLELTEHGYSR